MFNWQYWHTLSLSKFSPERWRPGVCLNKYCIILLYFFDFLTGVERTTKKAIVGNQEIALLMVRVTAQFRSMNKEDNSYFSCVEKKLKHLIGIVIRSNKAISLCKLVEILYLQVIIQSNHEGNSQQIQYPNSR